MPFLLSMFTAFRAFALSSGSFHNNCRPFRLAEMALPACSFSGTRCQKIRIQVAVFLIVPILHQFRMRHGNRLLFTQKLPLSRCGSALFGTAPSIISGDHRGFPFISALFAFPPNFFRISCQDFIGTDCILLPIPRLQQSGILLRKVPSVFYHLPSGICISDPLPTFRAAISLRPSADHCLPFASTHRTKPPYCFL